MEESCRLSLEAEGNLMQEDVFKEGGSSLMAVNQVDRVGEGSKGVQGSRRNVGWGQHVRTLRAQETNTQKTLTAVLDAQVVPCQEKLVRVNPLWRPIRQTNNKSREAEKGVDIRRKVESLRHSPEAAACSLFEFGDTESRCKEPSREWLVQCQNTKKG